MNLGATVPWAHQGPTTRTQTCQRCGLERKARKDTVLCGSCRYTLTPVEAKAWEHAA
ncbi:hypothetical protein DEU34_2240 [Microbacterium sp. AG1240]|nr:hypothetical protein DEU34_2240 [Microbacterium sp. AG1240]